VAVQQIRLNAGDDIVIAYETFGRRDDPAVVLVMGLGTQMLGWPDEFCVDLAGRGYYVIRFDNRDIGLSTHLHDAPSPDIRAVALRRRRPAYSLQDMADDTIGLLDALGLSRVHLVGASMGGFIAQLVALGQPQRIISLTLIMTSTGSRRVGQASRALVWAMLRRKPATEREAAIASSVGMYRLLRSAGYPADEEYTAALAAESYDRGYDPTGGNRQLGAVIGQSNRTKALRRLAIPTLVMHGLHDPLVRASGGLALARTIPGARFVGFHGVGHDLPRALWPRFASEIDDLARTAQPDRLADREAGVDGQ
jgi:pimeloyl-ACP methyl ester carboxylesterase